MQTLRIAVCDDDQQIINNITELLHSFFKQQNINIELEAFTNGRQCLSYLKQKTVDLIFLDIFLKDGDILGTELAMQMRSHNKEAKLIFLTTSNEFATESFEAHASYYLLKPLTAEKLYKAIDRCELFKLKQSITIDTGHSLLSLDLESVIVLEVQNKYTFIHTANGVIKELCPLIKFL